MSAPLISCFGASGNNGGVPLTASFQDCTTYDPADEPDTWVWDFGDGTSGSGRTTEHVYTELGTYAVRFTASNAFGSDTSGYLYAEAMTLGTQPDFSPRESRGAAPLIIAFTDRSYGPPDAGYPTSWLWDFGDGSVSTEQNPTHIYVTPGQYDVVLWATNAAGTNGFNQNDAVTALGDCVANFKADVVSGVMPLTVRFTDLSTNEPLWWWWDFSDGDGSVEQNPTHIYTEPGVYSVSLTVSNVRGD